MKKKFLGYYLGGAIVWFLGVSSMSTDKRGTVELFAAFFYLSAGIFFGFFGKELLVKRPWLLLLLPVLPLSISLLGWF
jgi:hypothetical protein